MTRLDLLAAGLALTIVSSSALAGGTITDGDSTFTLVGTPASGTLGNVTFEVGGAFDQAFYYSWGYRVPFNNQNSQMSRFDTPTESYVGDTAEIEWLNAGPGPAGFARFDAELTIELSDGPSNQALLISTMTIRNVNPTDLDLEIFNIHDLDIDATAGGEDGEITDAGEVRYRQLDDAGVLFAEILATDAGRFQVGPGSTIRNLVNDSTSVNLNNTPVFTGDAASGFQWSISLAPNETATLVSRVSFNAPVPTPGCAGDVDGDGDTDVFDFSDLAANFGAGPGATRAQGDLTGDGFVDVFDFSELAADFGCLP